MVKYFLFKYPIHINLNYFMKSCFNIINILDALAEACHGQIYRVTTKYCNVVIAILYKWRAVHILPTMKTENLKLGAK